MTENCGWNYDIITINVSKNKLQLSVNMNVSTQNLFSLIHNNFNFHIHCVNMCKENLNYLLCDKLFPINLITCVSVTIFSPMNTSGWMKCYSFTGEWVNLSHFRNTCPTHVAILLSHRNQWPR